MLSYNMRRHPHLPNFSQKTSDKLSHTYQTLNQSFNSNNLMKNDINKLKETIEVSKDSEIYFNRTKKYNYMKNIIDTYF